MGREIRRVPPNWKHPQDESEIYDPYGIRSPLVRRFKPLHEGYAEAVKKWKQEYAKWEAGERLKYALDDGSTYEFWESNPPPFECEYVSYSPKEATWYQMYETVSEGTPVTPPFESLKALSAYLSMYGDDYYQTGIRNAWKKEDATKFCGLSLNMNQNCALHVKHEPVYPSFLDGLYCHVCSGRGCPRCTEYSEQ